MRELVESEERPAFTLPSARAGAGTTTPRAPQEPSVCDPRARRAGGGVSTRGILGHVRADASPGVGVHASAVCRWIGTPSARAAVRAARGVGFHVVADRG
ncbi:hypothetical protein GCM10010505_19130 [Kitasatospora aburaviensis]